MPERYLGQTFGKYRIDSLVGTGGFAWVFKGYDPELEIPVAVKVLKPQFAGDTTLVDRFRREASTAAKLRHPNIIKIYAVGKEGDAVYFVMDYLPTGLAERLESTSALPEEYVVRIGIDVARALGFAHREGVIHRDIKVDNILFDAHGNAVVADFGIARAVTGYTQHTGTNMVVGTPQYFAPEQARAKPLDGRADIYSLGVTLYRATTGRLPFEGDDWYEIARQHVEEPPPLPRQFAPNMSVEFEQVVLRCLAKAPDDRPATGEQLAEMLDLILAQHRDPTMARTLTVPAQLTPTLVAPVPAFPAPPRRVSAKVLVPSAIGLLAISVMAWMIASGGFGASNAAPLTGDSTPPPLVIPAPDTSAGGVTKSVPDTTALSRDSVHLWLTGPPNAVLTFEGRMVGDSGKWRVDSVKPGDYKVSASVKSIAGCSTAIDSQTIKLRGGAVLRRVNLRPRACGVVEITPRWPSRFPGDPSFTLSGVGAPGQQGTLSLGKHQHYVVPAGKWELRVTKSLCFTYSDSVVVAPADTTRVTFTMACQ